MLEDHPKENPIKSSFFSRPPQYPLEVNSVYRPKFSNLVIDKPYIKPFYLREDKRSRGRIDGTSVVDEAIPTTADFNLNESNADVNIEPSKEPSHITVNQDIQGEDKSEEIEGLVHNDTSENGSTLESHSVVECGSEKSTDHVSSQGTSVSGVVPTAQIEQQSVTDASAFVEPINCQSIEIGKEDVPNNVAPTLMELPSSVYVPPFHSVPPVIMSQNLATFPSTPIDSFVNPLFVPQLFSPVQPPKPFPKSKCKQFSVPSAFQENGLYGMGITQNGSSKEYYVMVHVEAGATFSIRTGDQEQQIPGPATVRLVLNNGPPLPMPMQVPPGHLVQQIVDEDGVLTHVILSSISPYPQFKTGTPGLGNAPPNGPLPPANRCPVSGLPRPRFGATGGVNVIISPKTSPGLAVAGPAWPTTTMRTAVGEVVAPADAPPAPSAASTERHGRAKPEKQTVVKTEATDEALKGSLSSSSSSSKKQSSSASTKKKSSANSTGVNEGGKRRSTVAKRSSKIPSVGVTAPSPVSESTSENVEKCNGKASRTAGLKEAEPAKEASISSKIPPGLHDDFSSIAFDSADGRPVTASTLTSKELPTKASVDANLPQRAAKPVNVVRPTNGGRPLSALNGDLTPAEACELKASLGKTNTKHLASSLSSAPPPPIHVAGQPDNVWTARNLTVHANTEPKSSPAPQTPPPTSLSEKSSPKDEDTEKPKNCSASTTSTKLVKSGPSEKRKKQSKGADSLKQKVASSASEVGLGDMKIAKKDQHLGGNLPAGNLPPAATATTLDVTEQAPIFLLSPTPGTSHPSQHPYYFGPPFYAAGGPHPSTFFAAPRHTHFGPPAPSPCFIPPPPPPSHFQQTHHSPTPPPPYFFSPANPAAVVAGTPYLSFQLPPPPISHGLPAHLHAGGPNSAGTPVLGVPHTIPFVAQAATAGGGTMALGEEERNAIIQVLSKIGPPEISSVDCRSVTINISVPENLSIGVQEQPLEDTSKAKGNFNGHKEEFNAEECSRVGVEDADTVQASSPNGPSGSDAAECPPTPSTAKLWSIPPSELRFALYLAERNENFVCVYVGEATCILLQDLRPGVQYNIKVCCMYEGLCGGISESTEFVTLATKPACPRPPNVFSRTKSTLSVRWAVPADNGAKITSYCLQYAAITKGGGTPSFQVCYAGSQRFHKLSHLLPATTYMLRVSATNAHGQSPWSDVVSVMTYGLPPSSPEPPRLLKATARSLHLTWGPQSGGSENASKTSSAPSKPILRYMLEMQEGEARQHFKKVFDDDATQFIVEGLRRCSLYRFRLAATNVDGMSHWSEIVAFRTTPDVPTAPKGLRLRGRVRPYNINVCWLSPEDDGGLPVSAYRLEVFMPRLPSPLLRKYSTQPHKKNTHLTQATAVPDDFKVVETMSPICWPWVIATSDNNAFTCVPPSIHVLQPPSTSLYSAGKVNDAPQAPFRVPSSNDPIWASTEESATLSSPYVSESSDNEDGEPKCAWYSIYEGRTKEVSVCNLTPGQTFQFRVRATSCRTNAPGQNASRKNSSNPVFWGCASESLLKVTTPAVPPINPPSNLRLFGRPKPTGIRLTWDPPTSNGGAPILSYEVWQSLCDPISGSPIKLPSPKNASPMVTVSSESMQDLHSALAQHSSPPALSAPSSVSSSPLHQSGKAPNSRLVFSGGENSCEISGLHSGQSFAFRVRARNSTGWSDWSEWCTFSTAPSPPGEPSGPPRVKPTSATSVAVSWERVEQTNGAEITEYRVEWQPNVVEPSETCTPPERDQVDLVLSPTENSVNGSKISASSSSTCPPTCPNDGFQLVYSGGECHFELHDLQPASRIAFRVCAVNSAGAGKWSPLGGCVMPASRPGQPSGLALDRSAVSPTGEAETCVGGVSMTTARLVWIVPVDNGCPITSYNLELTRYNGHISQASLTTVSGNSGTKQFPLCVDGGDLIPVSPEPLSLEDECKADGGDVGGCDLRNVLCISGSPSLLSSSSSSLSPIPSVGVEPGSAPSSNVSSESGRPRHHHALSRPSSLKARHLAPGGGRAVEYVRYKLTGLDIGAKYRVRVQALNAVGVSPFSGILHFSTLPQLPPPPTLCCVGSTAGSIKLRWSASSPDSAHDDSDDGPSKPRPSTPPANIKYVLEMSKKPESKGWVTVFEGPQTSFKARKLTEATLYYFRVAAVNVSGKGAFSEVISEKTAYLHPPPVDAPQVVEVDCTACKLQWPALNSIGQDPLIYLVHLTQVPSAVSASIESEEDAVTVYRGAETSCTITNLSPGRNYIARVCAIRCCQKETVDDQSLTPPKTTLQCNNRDIDQDADASQLTLPTHASTSCSPKITLLHGPFSVGTAFTTLAQKQTPVGQLINSLWCRTPFTREQSTFPLPTLHFRRPNLTSHLATLTAWVHRARASAAFRRLIIRPATSSRDRAQRRMACLLVVGFVLFTLLCAWFANQFLLKFSDESPAVRWPGGGALEDSSSSARAALYATRGRQHHQP